MYNQFWDEMKRPHGKDHMIVTYVLDQESTWPNLIADFNELIPDDATDVEVQAFRLQFKRPMNTGEVDEYIKMEKDRAERRREYHLRALADIRETYGPDPEDWPTDG